jgi:hypothetical protein
MMAKGRKRRWLLRERCGCRVLNPNATGGIGGPPRLRHCALHGAAWEMLCLLAELYFTNDPRWQGKVDSLLREHANWALQDLRRDFKQDLGKKSQQALRHYMDAETAILEGRRDVDRTKTTCRLCSTTLEDDDLARLLHLRSSHRKEWLSLTD